MKNLRKQSQNSNNELSLKNEIIGILILFVAIFLIFSIFSYVPSDPSFFNSSPGNLIENYGGRIGSEVSALIFNLLGLSSYIIIIYSLFMASYFLFNKKIENILSKSFGYLILVFSSSALVSNIKPFYLIDNIEVKTGGIIGYFTNGFFVTEIKEFFSFVLFFLLLVISLTLVARFSLKTVAKLIFDLSVRCYRFLEKLMAGLIERYKKGKRIKKIEKKYNTKISPVKKTVNQENKMFREKKEIVKRPSKIPEEGSLFAKMEVDLPSKEEYQTPPLTYLDASTEKSQIDYKELEMKKEELSRRLNEFRIKGEILEYSPGPIITTYEFVPDIGVKVKEVTNLSEDLALVAKAQYVRIERILGKKAIGIEIPNKKKEIIHLRDIIESEEYQNSSSPLSIALGKTKSGEVFVADLRDMPHLIIAGATGMGKSIAIHTIIISILYKSSPDMVKLILIDPKSVELAIYNSLPHLLTPVVVTAKLAKNTLDWAVFEMEERYKKLALLQVRNIDQYNKKLQLLIQTEEGLPEKLESLEKLPYIVIIIDEFADLMIVSGREIEENIARIAQKARAVGIHLILATQRPSTDIITGTIKNNFPARIALGVPSKIDSRTIIDVMGAEKLLGNGDMLFLPPKTASLIRLHCAFVSEEETLRVVNYLAKLAKPKYNTQVIKPRESTGQANGNTQLDFRFFDAAELVINTRQASASFLQRKLSVGYARAGRLIDQLELKGVVSAPNSKNQRDILMGLDDLEGMEEDE